MDHDLGHDPAHKTVVLAMDIHGDGCKEVSLPTMGDAASADIGQASTPSNEVTTVIRL